MNIISEFETAEGELITVTRDDNNRYHVTKDNSGYLIQPNHDAEGIIRYLSHYIHALEWKLNKMNNSSNQLNLTVLVDDCDYDYESGEHVVWSDYKPMLPNKVIKDFQVFLDKTKSEEKREIVIRVFNEYVINYIGELIERGDLEAKKRKDKNSSRHSHV